MVVVLAGDQDIAAIWTKGEVARPGTTTINDFDPDEVAVCEDAIGGDGVFAAGRHTEELPVGTDVDIGHRVVAEWRLDGRMLPQRAQGVFGVRIDCNCARNFVCDVQKRFAGVEHRVPRSRARFGGDGVHAPQLIGLWLDRIKHQFVGAQVCRDDKAAVRGYRCRMGMRAALAGCVGTAADMLA